MHTQHTHIHTHTNTQTQQTHKHTMHHRKAYWIVQMRDDASPACSGGATRCDIMNEEEGAEKTIESELNKARNGNTATSYTQSSQLVATVPGLTDEEGNDEEMMISCTNDAHHAMMNGS